MFNCKCVSVYHVQFSEVHMNNNKQESVTIFFIHLIIAPEIKTK